MSTVFRTYRGRAVALAACFSLLSCNSPTVSTPDAPSTSSVQEALTGHDGALAVTTANTVVNQYAVLGADVVAGATSITITNAGDFTQSGAFTSAFGAGDLVMLYQPQGATIDATDSAAYGAVGAAGGGGAGNYELAHVTGTSNGGTTIALETSCGGLAHAYTTAGHTEVIRVPQATTITVSGTGSITATAWDGARGGVVALQAQTSVTVDGAGIDASGKGFRGGVIDNQTTGPPGTVTIRAAGAATGAEKGEGIAGFEAKYDASFNGRYGRGAPANGGGGGDAHNAGGGGGANGDSGDAYTGAGNMDGTVVGASAWTLDPDFISNGNALTTSAGGGRGGYTFAATNKDALTVGPGTSTWNGDTRRSVGGFGGHPVANDPATHLFLGGGGGAGDGNNNSAGAGGAGGGLVFVIADGVAGGGVIQSNGAVGANTHGTNNDAPGGGGAGGTVIIKSTTLAGVTLHADGGVGGNQLAITTESEGPGGGGGGGYIAVAAGSVTRTAVGGAGGTSASTGVTEFPTNGATAGGDGETNATVTSLAVCAADDLSVTVTDGSTTATPGTTVTYTIVATNGGADVINGATLTDAFPGSLSNVTWTCTASTGSTCSAASGTGDLAEVVKLAPSGTVTYVVTGTIDSAATGTLSDTAKIATPAGITDASLANNTATDTDTLVGSADLSLAIADAPDPVTVNGTLTYSVTATNAGPSAAQSLTVTDTLPAGTTFVSASGAGWTCSALLQVVTCTRTTLGVTTSPAITIVVTAPATAGTIVDNATISATTADPNNGNNSASASTTVSASADLSIAITDAPDPVAAGGTLTYTVAVNNAGPTAATSVTVTDTLPVGATFVSATGTGWTCSVAGQTVTCTRATAATGAQPTIAIVVTAPTAGGSITDTGTVSATTPDPSVGNNSASQSTTVSASADLALTISDSPDPVTAGGTLTYTLSSTNGGPSVAQTVTLTDTLPAGATFVSASGAGWACTVAGQVVTCTRATAAAGAQPAVTIVVTAPTTAGTIVDTGTIAATTSDPDSTNNTATASTTVAGSADLGIAISDSPDPVAAGGTLTYTVATTNGGPSAASTVTVTDTLPAGATFVSASGTGWTCTQSGGVVTCTRATAAAGAQPPISIVVTAPAAGGSISDSATIAATTPDPDPSNNSATQTSTVSASADLAITLTDAPDPVTAGGTLTYTATVTNNGPSAATNVTVTDTLPAGATFVSATGTGWTCSVSGQVVTCTRAAAAAGAQPPIAIVVTAPTAGGSITDTANVAATTADPSAGNNTASQSTTVTGSADLAVAITDSPDPVTASGTLTYTVSSTNGGPSAAATVTLSDTIPAGTTFVSAAGTGWACSTAGQVVTCTRAAAAVGAQPDVTIVVTVPTTGGTIVDNASIGAATSDPDLTNNTATATTTVAGSADLGIAITDSPDPVAAGGTLTYTVTTSNAGPSAASTVTVTDTLPAGATFVSASGTGWSCTQSGGVVTCTRAAAATGAQPPISIVVTAPTAGGSITDSATISAVTADPDPSNNSATQTSTVSASADLAITLTDSPDPVPADGALTYTATVTNNGPSTATNVTVTDTLPAGSTFVSATGTGWTCSAAGQVVTCTIASAPVGALPPISIVIAAPASGGTISDTAHVAATTADPSAGNNTATQTTTVTGVADLAIALTEAPDPVTAGGTLTYTATVTDNGPSTASTVTVSDTLPAGSTFVSATGTGWSCTEASLVVTCTRAAAALGAEPPITIVATAPTAGGPITDSASVAALTPDPDTTNNATSIDSNVTASSDLGVTVTASPDPVTAGGTITYTVGVTDGGPSDGGTITVTDTLPPGSTFIMASGTGWTCTQVGQVVTCTAPSSGPGAQPPITITATAPVEGGSATDTVTVTSTVTDPNPANNTASTTTTIDASSDLAIAVTAAPSPVSVGAALTYTVAVTNLGPSTSSTVTVTDTLPAGDTFVSASGTGWTCSAVGQVVTCTTPSLPAGAAPPITIVTTAPGATGSIIDTATVAAATPDPVTTNNTASVTVDVTQNADLGVTITGSPDPVTPGGTLTYTVGVTNSGPATATGVVVTDTFPDGVTIVSAGGPGWTCTITGQTVTCTEASQPAGMAPPITIVVTTPPGSGGLSDTVTVTSATADPNMTNNTATFTSAAGTDADLAIEVREDVSTVQVAGKVTYQLFISNLGPAAATNVVVTDVLPGDSVASLTASGNGWTCVAERCTRATFDAGATSSITIVVTAPSSVGTFTNTGTVSSDTSDPVLANNTSSITIDVTDTGFGVRGGGCDTSGTGGAGGMLVVLGALALTVRRRRGLALVAGLGAIALVTLTAAPASAQIAGSPQTFTVERFRLATDGEGLINVEWADVLPRGSWNLAAWVGYANDPLVVYDKTTNERVESLVHHRLGGSIQGAVSVTKYLQLGLEVPLIFDQTNQGIETLPAPDSPKFGDIRFLPKLVLRKGGGVGHDRVSVAVMLGITVPSGGSSGYAGDDNLTFQPELLVSRPIGAVRLSGSIGYYLRKETQVANLDVDDELNVRLGVGYRFADRTSGWHAPLELDATFYAATPAKSPFSHINTDPHEVDIGAGYKVHRDVTVYGLGGMGIGAGFGAPDWRILAGVRYAHTPPAPPKVIPPKPEPVIVPVVVPVKEDPDSDGDGLKDSVDKCPNEPEDKDGFQDEDGCPDPDNDADGTPDVTDKCPLVPGPVDNAGCPDPDRDGDGVVDRLDNCPDEKGTPENAGCPTKQLVKITDTKLEILESVYFKLDKAVIEPRSFALLDNVAQVLGSHEKLVIQVEGHTDSQGKPAYNKDLSQRRAQAVVDYLAKKGVDKARLKPVGYGQDNPVADNKTAAGRAQNRRVVFLIVTGTEGANIENHQQGAGDDTKESEKKK